MAKRTPEEILQAIEDAPLDDEAERVLAMTREERERELEAAGIDLDEVDAAADAVYQRLRGAADARRSPREPVWVPSIPAARARRWSPVGLAAAAAVALLVGALGVTRGPAVVAWLKGTPEPIGPAIEPPRPLTPRELAQKTRDEAEQACASQLWGLCGDKLDEARKLDPAGDSEERVQRLRRTITQWTTFVPEPKDKRRPK
jgi:hypothetical protein